MAEFARLMILIIDTHSRPLLMGFTRYLDEFLMLMRKILLTGHKKDTSQLVATRNLELHNLKIIYRDIRDTSVTRKICLA